MAPELQFVMVMGVFAIFAFVFCYRKKVDDTPKWEPVVSEEEPLKY